MKEIVSYVVVYKSSPDISPITRLSVEGGKRLLDILSNDPPLFIPIKDKIVARSEIKSVEAVYK